MLEVHAGVSANCHSGPAEGGARGKRSCLAALDGIAGPREHHTLQKRAVHEDRYRNIKGTCVCAQPQVGLVASAPAWQLLTALLAPVSTTAFTAGACQDCALKSLQV